jgi:hypothetical protein
MRRHCVLVGIGFVLVTGVARLDAGEPAASARPSGAVIPLERATPGDFEKMPDGQLIEIHGRTTTKRAFLARQKAMAAKIQQELERRRDAFERAERDRVERQNATTRADMSRLVARAENSKQPERWRAFVRDAQAVLAEAEKKPGDQQLEHRATELLDRYHALLR